MGKRVCIDPWFYLFAAAAVMLLPIRWMLGSISAALFHELCHIAAIIAVDGKVKGILVRPTGAVILIAPMSNLKELVCAAAGPTGSFLLLAAGRWFPEIAICGLVQGTFNLLPIYPLDGGRMVMCVFSAICDEMAEIITGYISLISAVLMAVYSLFLGFLPGLFIFAQLTGDALRKIPCKEGKLAVQ